MPDVKLIALDADDLAVISAHLQDAVLTTADMAYLPRERRFALVCNRLDRAETPSGRSGRRTLIRRRAGIRFERVLAVRTAGVDRERGDACHVLLAVTHEVVAGREPEAYIELVLAGGAAVRLHVECIEAELRDLGAAWSTARKPDHGD